MTKEEIDEFIKVPIDEEFFNSTKESVENAKEAFDDEDLILICVNSFPDVFHCLGSCLFTYQQKPENNDISPEEVLQDYFYTQRFIENILDLMYKKFPEIERTEEHDDIDVKEVYENSLEETLNDLLSRIKTISLSSLLGIEEFSSKSLLELTVIYNTFKLFDECL